jgi:hypothetical protein
MKRDRQGRAYASTGASHAASGAYSVVVVARGRARGAVMAECRAARAVLRLVVVLLREKAHGGYRVVVVVVWVVRGSCES